MSISVDMFVCWVVDKVEKKNFFFDLPLSLFPSICLSVCLSVCWVVDKVEKNFYFFLIYPYYHFFRRYVCLLVRFAKILKDPYFCPSLSVVCLSVCLCVCGRHFYQLALDNFDETWSQVSYYDSLLPRP